MNPTLTTIFAIWGAALGSLSLFWNIWTWMRARPRIMAIIELRESGMGQQIHYEIRNRGDKPTTIEEIMLVKYQDGFRGLLGAPEYIQFVSARRLKDGQLPAVLPPGGFWTCAIPLVDDRILKDHDKIPLIQEGRLYYKIRCAHTDRSLSGKVKNESFFTRL